ncbi:MAG: Sec-independent protein translocase protein TatB [Sphingomonas adhaesiva]|uniref:Sec-independent protein translocase protein TatB n=1 Tax=Sphingomonas adhaesiva TaxID=28212 RepID=UPI002FF9A51E
MFDIAPSELLLVAFVALVVIGPKDLPKAMRVVGYWVGRARAVGRQFRAGFDEMVREAELEEMEKKWKAENERIMREHPFIPSPPPEPAALPAPDAPRDGAGMSADQPDGHEVSRPVMVEKPVVAPAEHPTAPVAPAEHPTAPVATDKAPS